MRKFADARRGVLWRAYEKHYGKAGAVPLVWQAPTLAMNLTVPQSVIDGALADDEAAARAEYLAEFRSDLEAFVKLDTVESLRRLLHAARPRLVAQVFRFCLSVWWQLGRLHTCDWSPREGRGPY